MKGPVPAICAVLSILLLTACPFGPAETYTVTYDGNGATGGTVPLDSREYEEGDTVTVKANTGGLVLTGKAFSGWNSLSSGTGTNYPVSSVFEMGSSDRTLYAKWVDAEETADVELADPETLSVSIRGSKPFITDTEVMNLEAIPTSEVDLYSWYLDAVLYEEGAALDTLVLDGADLDAASHTMALFVRSGDLLASVSFNFTVLIADTIDFESGILPEAFTLYTDANGDGTEETPEQGDGEWAIVSDESHGGGKSVRAGTLLDDGYCYMDYESSVPAGLSLKAVSYWYKVSSEEDYDFYNFYTWTAEDEWVFIHEDSGDVDWTQYRAELNFPAGTEYSLSWGYEKDESESSLDDTAWVDDIVLTFAAE